MRGKNKVQTIWVGVGDIYISDPTKPNELKRMTPMRTSMAASEDGMIL
jgi:hypothetical protein